MRKFFGFIVFMALAVLLVPWLHPRAEAAVVAPDQARIAKFWIGKDYYEVDGKRIGMDVAPYIKNDRTMMPARFLARSLGIPEDNIQWDPGAQTVTIERGPYPYQGKNWLNYSPDQRNDYIFMTIGQKLFTVNGYPNLGSFDVPPEIVDPGRTMIPYRAVAQALGAMVFWNDDDQCVTVETWREVPPLTPYTVKKVTVANGSVTANVVKADGTETDITTEYPTYITDPRDGGFTLDAIEWFKLWGVPESSILYDPVRGGLTIRAKDNKFTLSADDTAGKVAVGYLYFYIGEKNAWDSFFQQTRFKPTDSPGYNVIWNGRFYSGGAARYGVAKLYGKSTGGGNTGNENLYNEILN